MKIEVKDYYETGKEITITITNNGKKSTKTFYYTPKIMYDGREELVAKSNSKTPIYDFINMIVLESIEQKDVLKVSKEQIKAKKDAETAQVLRLAEMTKAFEVRRKAALKARKAQGLCNAVLYHGPGHQSKTFCECKGPHKKHKCTYGSYNEEAEWTGMEGTGSY